MFKFFESEALNLTTYIVLFLVIPLVLMGHTALTTKTPTRKKLLTNGGLLVLLSILIASLLLTLLDAVGELVGREIEKKALEALKYCVMRLETVDEEEPEEDLPEAMKELVREVNIDIDVSMAEPEDLELPDESDESSKD